MVVPKYHALTQSHSDMFPDWGKGGVEFSSLQIVLHPGL